MSSGTGPFATNWRSPRCVCFASISERSIVRFGRSWRALTAPHSRHKNLVKKLARQTSGRQPTPVWVQRAPGTRVPTERLSGDRLRSAITFTSMESEYDPESEANAAMKLAVAAHGLERQKWLNLAIAWRELARGRPSRQPHKTNVEAA
jgi:hypothetical protein